MGDFNLNIATSFGLLLAVCLLVGIVAERFHFPKVTAYLLVGLVAGPSVLHWLPESHIHELTTITKLAMALVLFNLGCHFSLTHVRRVLKRSVSLSFGELGATWLAVALGLLLFGQSWEVAVLLASLALATAPATTILVLKESASEGPVTEHASTLVAMNNFASIVVFEVFFIVVHLVHGKLVSPVHIEIGWLTRDILGSLALGLFAGFAVSYGCGMLKQGRWLVLLTAAITIVFGCCEMLAMPYMLAFLAMGVIVVNTSDVTDKIVGELDHLTGLLCVVFFAVHGAELDLSAFQAAGLVGVIYIVTRSIGKVGGIMMAARVIGEPPTVQRWLGPSMLAQAGAAIALAAIAVDRDPELGRPIQTVILGSVVFFEIVGPFLIRESVLRSGEVPVAQAFQPRSAGSLSQIGAIWYRLLAAFGYETDTRTAADLTVADLMRQNVKGIAESASFDEVVDYIEHSRDNSYPVVDAEGQVVGVICYSRFSSVLFDRSAAALVCAEDLATAAMALLYPDDTASQALELFRNGTEDCIPVVSRDQQNKLVGVVRKSDVTNLLIRGHRSS